MEQECMYGENFCVQKCCSDMLKYSCFLKMEMVKEYEMTNDKAR